MPDLVTIGDESFLADGIYLGGPRVDRGTLDAGAGDASATASSSAITPCSVRGRGCADETLLGVCTVATPAMATAPGGVARAIRRCRCRGRRRRPIERTTHEPSLLRRLNRFAVGAARLLLPLGLLLVGRMVGSSTC